MTAEPPDEGSSPSCDKCDDSSKPRLSKPKSAAVCPCFFCKEHTMKQAVNFIESVFSFAVFLAVTLAIASTTYQLLNPDGGIVNWIARAWEINPILVIVLGGITFWVKRWLSGAQGDRAVDLVFYAAVILGLCYGFNLLVER